VIAIVVLWLLRLALSIVLFFLPKPPDAARELASQSGPQTIELHSQTRAPAPPNATASAAAPPAPNEDGSVAGAPPRRHHLARWLGVAGGRLQADARASLDSLGTLRQRLLPSGVPWVEMHVEPAPEPARHAGEESADDSFGLGLGRNETHSELRPA